MYVYIYIYIYIYIFKMQFISVMQIWNFRSDVFYSSLVSHDSSKNYSNMQILKHFLLLSMLKTVVLLTIFVETLFIFFFIN